LKGGKALEVLVTRFFLVKTPGEGTGADGSFRGRKGNLGRTEKKKMRAQENTRGRPLVKARQKKKNLLLWSNGVCGQAREKVGGKRCLGEKKAEKKKKKQRGGCPNARKEFLPRIGGFG